MYFIHHWSFWTLQRLKADRYSSGSDRKVSTVDVFEPFFVFVVSVGGLDLRRLDGLTSLLCSVGLPVSLKIIPLIQGPNASAFLPLGPSERLLLACLRVFTRGAALQVCVCSLSNSCATLCGNAITGML